MTSQKTSSKPKLSKRLNAEAASGWSNDMDDEDEDVGDPPNRTPNPAALLKRNSRRSGDEVAAAAIPTIPTDDADEVTETIPQVAVAPTFSVNQIASFNQIEKQFSRERTSQYIDSKIDLGMLYHNLHLHENLDTEDDKVWDWDRVFVEIRNSITHPSINA